MNCNCKEDLRRTGELCQPCRDEWNEWLDNDMREARTAASGASQEAA